MPRRSDAPPLTRGVLLRGTIFTVAVALGAVAVWLIVTSKTQKSIELGVLAGLWGLLLGTFSMLGTRRGTMGADPAPRAADAGNDERDPGSAVEMRSNAAVERIEETLERRAWQERLEQLVRSEIQEGVSREVSQLRAEIASLRGELLEKVGGQLRLERIETTRVIGSDLEALQHEVRQLKFAQDPDVADIAAARMVAPSVARSVVQPAQVRPVSRQTADVESDVQPARRFEPQPQIRRPSHHSAAAEPEPVPAAQPERPARARHSTPEDETGPIRATSWPVPQPAPAPAPQPAPAAPSQPQPPAAQPQPAPPQPPAPQAQPAPPQPQPAPPQPPAPRVEQPAPAPQPAPRGPGRIDDDFAALPRLTPFVDIGAEPDTSPAPGSDSAPSPYSGRRRRSDERELDEAASARHADRSTGRRHRRDDDEDDEDADAGDLLARLLSREGARH